MQRGLQTQEYSQAYILSLAAAYKSGAPPAVVLDASPTITTGVIAATNYLHQDPETLSRLWESDDRIRAVDMESAGFAAACMASVRSRQWLVVRAVSDFGTPE